MDANKLEKLKEIDYHVPKTCGLCVHSSFPPTKDWGECTKQTYEHLKHTDNPRQLSIYRGGTCGKFVMDPIALHKLGAFEDLVR